MASPSGNNKDADAESDYGSELDYNDTDLETQLTQLEEPRPPPAPVLPTPIPPLVVQQEASTVDQLRHVEIAVASTSEEPAVDEASGDSYAEVLEKALEELEVQLPPKKSLWERYRKRKGWGGLSVTDLVGPSWCEVQHSYRLSSKSHLPPSQRPTEIVTSTGSTIALNQKRTVKRDAVLAKGTAVHATIEKEVMGEQEKVEVRTEGKEDWWALRIVNLLVALEVLVETGRTREVPVFGFVEDFLVLGVIDEIERRDVPRRPPTPPAPVATASTSKKRSAPATPKKDVSQQTLDAFFSPSPTKAAVDASAELDEAPPPPVPPPQSLPPLRSLILSDTKTRFNATLPPPSDTRSTHLQLTLYHQLFLSLLTPLPWTRLYSHLSLSPTTPLSLAFLSSISPILLSSTTLAQLLTSSTTLQQFVDALQTYVGLLPSVEGTVEVSYRTRANKGRRWKKKKVVRREKEDEEVQQAIRRSLEESQSGGGGVVADEDEEEEMRKALAMSLEVADETKIVGVRGTAVEEEEATVSAPSTIAVPDVGDEPLPTSAAAVLEEDDLFANSQSIDLPAAPAVPLPRRSRRTRPSAPTPAPSTSKRSRPRSPSTSRLHNSNNKKEDSSSSEEELTEGALIGVERFEIDLVALSEWTSEVAKLWRGEREPRGVSQSQVGRCRTCEFEEGCEWREAKAKEAVEENVRKRKEREEKENLRKSKATEGTSSAKGKDKAL